MVTSASAHSVPITWEVLILLSAYLNPSYPIQGPCKILLLSQIL